MQIRHQQQAVDRKWIIPLAIGSICSLFLLLLTNLASSSGQTRLIPFSVYGLRSSVFVESKINPLSVSVSVSVSPPPPPRLAYLISGSSGDGQMLKRTLMALYHPNNQYVVHLDREASPEERLDLSGFVANHTLFQRFQNVRVIVKANFVTYRGPTMVANTLHAAAILLREGGDWDWFINLSASDYPLVTQDGNKIKLPCFNLLRF